MYFLLLKKYWYLPGVSTSCCLLTTVHTDRIVDFWLVYICYQTFFLTFIYFQQIRRSFNNKKEQKNTMNFHMPATNSGVLLAEQVSRSRTFSEWCIMVNEVPDVHIPQTSAFVWTTERTTWHSARPDGGDCRWQRAAGSLKYVGVLRDTLTRNSCRLRGIWWLPTYLNASLRHSASVLRETPVMKSVELLSWRHIMTLQHHHSWTWFCPYNGVFKKKKLFVLLFCIIVYFI